MWTVRALLAWAACAVFFAVALGGGTFFLMRLLSWSLFVHAPLLLASVAALSWRFARRLRWALVVLSLLLLGTGVDAFFIEPYWLQVTHHEIRSPKIAAPLRIVVLADLQTDTVGSYEERVLLRVRQENPDLVLLPGDFIQEHNAKKRARLIKQLRRLLVKTNLAPRLGVVAVGGNTDSADWPRIFAGLPATTTVTATRTFQFDWLQLVALDEDDSCDTEISVPATEKFQLVFGHSPDFALGDVPADLLVAGHTHGGQVRLPLVGPLLTFSHVPRDWAAGRTQLPGNQPRTLVVSRGVGMERHDAPRIRFLCRPELVVIDLLPGN